MPFLFDAMRRRSPVTFGYRGETRHLHPYGLLSRSGHWYAIGWDEDRRDIRSFRADRIDSVPEPGPPGSFERPADFDPRTALRQHPWRFGDEEPVEVLLLVDADQAGWVVDEVGEETVVERRDGGAVVIALTVTNRAALRSFALGLLDHAEVLSPADVRADLIAWLEAVA
jgi:predicted DNA-binding transcriptional regulator YafY